MRVCVPLLFVVLMAGVAQVGQAREESRAPVLLTYVSAGGGLCAVRADGSHPQRLTPRRSLAGPAWSPSGRYVAFSRASGLGGTAVLVADARGKIRWRFGVGKHNGGPVWSPDGLHIAYFAGWAHIYSLNVADRDGSHDVSVATSPGWPSYGPSNPAWSPDGQRLAFDDGNDLASAPQGIYSTRADGADRRLLVAHAVEPAYSPDGTRLAFVALRDHERVGVYVANADGSDPRLVSSGAATWPQWSPDSTRLAFRSGSGSDLGVANAHGSGERVISRSSRGRIIDWAPRWSPTGTLIAFTRGPATVVGNEPFTSSIVVAHADGSGERIVVRRVGTSFVQPPAWRSSSPLPSAERPSCPRR